MCRSPSRDCVYVSIDAKRRLQVCDERSGISLVASQGVSMVFVEEETVLERLEGVKIEQRLHICVW